MVAWY